MTAATARASAPTEAKAVVHERASTAAAVVRREPAADPLGSQDAGQCACGGGCPGCAAAAAGVQPKLLVGALDDPAERDADKVADAIVGGGPEPLITASAAQTIRRCGATPSDQCPCHGGEGESDTIARAPAPGAAHDHALAAGGPAPAAVASVIGAGGSTLDPAVRATMESRFGTDFGHVRVHTDDRAAQSAASISARAYTLGSDVVFGAGQYAPATSAGLHTLAHELTHVVQQQSGHGVRGPPAGVDSDQFTTIRRQAIFGADAGPRECRLGRTTPAAFDQILFPNAVSQLTDLDRSHLANVIVNWRAGGANQTVRIDGYASTPGSDASNLTLSCARAQSVAAELESPVGGGSGIPSTLITTFMHGETNEFGTDADNRRATILFGFGPSPEPEPEPEQQHPTPRRVTCGSCPTPDCPSDFCSPFPTTAEAIQSRNENINDIVDTIRGLDSGSGDLFREYLLGGSSTQRDLSAQFANQFTLSADTIATTDFLTRALEAAVAAHPPVFPPGENHVTIDVPTTIPAEVAAIDNCNSPHAMTFSNPFEAPGLIAGGVGSDETCTRVGAVPSNFPDRRTLTGTAEVTRNSDGTFLVAPSIIYTVEDTIDFCPGNCGGFGAQHFGRTVLMSRYEASGISGDIPFRVTFGQPIGAAGSEIP